MGSSRSPALGKEGRPLGQWRQTAAAVQGFLSDRLWLLGPDHRLALAGEGATTVGVPGPCHSCGMQNAGTTHSAGLGAPRAGCGCDDCGMEWTGVDSTSQGLGLGQCSQAEICMCRNNSCGHHGCGPTVAVNSAGIWSLPL